MVDQKNWDLDVKARIVCGGCGMLAHKPEDCYLAKGNCHICLGHPEGSSKCKAGFAVQFLQFELENWYPGPGYPPDEWMYMTMPRSNGRLSWGSAEGVAGLHRG